MKKFTKFMAVTLVISSLFSVGVYANPEDVTETQDIGQRHERPVMSEELKARIEALKEEGKTREEIGTILESEGYEKPARPERLERPGMTDELKARIVELRAEGMTEDEIDATLQAEGYEKPAKAEGKDGQGRSERQGRKNGQERPVTN